MRKVVEVALSKPVAFVVMVLWFALGITSFIGVKPTIYLRDHQDGNPLWYRIGGALEILNGGAYLLRFLSPKWHDLSIKLSAVFLVILEIYTAFAFIKNKRTEE